MNASVITCVSLPPRRHMPCGNGATNDYLSSRGVHRLARGRHYGEAIIGFGLRASLPTAAHLLSRDRHSIDVVLESNRSGVTVSRCPALRVDKAGRSRHTGTRVPTRETAWG